MCSLARVEQHDKKVSAIAGVAADFAKADMCVKHIIGDDEARERIADLRAQRSQVEAGPASLEEAPKIITLHQATLERYVETVDALRLAWLITRAQATTAARRLRVSVPWFIV